MSNSFTNQIMAQLELFTQAEPYATRSTCSPSTSTRRWPDCTSTPSASSSPSSSPDQADYIGVPVEGPYKSDHYRY